MSMHPHFSHFAAPGKECGRLESMKERNGKQLAKQFLVYSTKHTIDTNSFLYYISLTNVTHAYLAPQKRSHNKNIWL